MGTTQRKILSWFLSVSCRFTARGQSPPAPFKRVQNRLIVSTGAVCLAHIAWLVGVQASFASDMRYAQAEQSQYEVESLWPYIGPAPGEVHSPVLRVPISNAPDALFDFGNTCYSSYKSGFFPHARSHHHFRVDGFHDWVDSIIARSNAEMPPLDALFGQPFTPFVDQSADGPKGLRIYFGQGDVAHFSFNFDRSMRDVIRFAHYFDPSWATDRPHTDGSNFGFVSIGPESQHGGHSAATLIEHRRRGSDTRHDFISQLSLEQFAMRDGVRAATGPYINWIPGEQTNLLLEYSWGLYEPSFFDLAMDEGSIGGVVHSETPRHLYRDQPWRLFLLLGLQQSPVELGDELTVHPQRRSRSTPLIERSSIAIKNHCSIAFRRIFPYAQTGRLVKPTPR